ncbi:uncharacterized protein B0H18DRAFT_173768 [Fomitopsis serialis]|uniref:uncharacterized protein n=1 Tax=Fomitopsis serialis TaxID=139415 RepID=UPI0020073901|nr:uncharacterized protein B0H18DRAFT_173768 [Neoantrodia serialis]KAH9929756.1 hypothetical protein B0H18DRAFT_173768 [Neoantrodia serialis]
MRKTTLHVRFLTTVVFLVVSGGAVLQPWSLSGCNDVWISSRLDNLTGPATDNLENQGRIGRGLGVGRGGGCRTREGDTSRRSAGALYEPRNCDDGFSPVQHASSRFPAVLPPATPAT